MIMHGDRDGLVPPQQSEALHAALLKAGVESRLEVIAGADHGGSDFATPQKLQMMVEFFERSLGQRVAQSSSRRAFASR
jgi:dipeptidyl aminopeptidase/acylaminoacyl peptidase